MKFFRRAASRLKTAQRSVKKALPAVKSPFARSENDAMPAFSSVLAARHMRAWFEFKKLFLANF